MDDTGNISIPEALRRLVRARLRDPWFRSELRAAFASGDIQALILEVLAPRIDHAVNRAISARLKRESFRGVVRELLEEIDAPRKAD